MTFKEFKEYCSNNFIIKSESYPDSKFVLYSKKGGKIHIKEKNKGTFTEYCGGNVTSECIKRGKNSPDPKIRKKATFAANSRKWNKK